MSEDRNIKVLKDVEKILRSIKQEDIDALNEYELVIFQSEIGRLKGKLAELEAKMG
jgi:hypothetical protein